MRVIQWDGRGSLELGPGYDPSFVPDGSAVVFEAFDEHGPDLWIYSFEDRSRRRLLGGAPRASRYTPAVSPDGSQVAFTCDGRLQLVGLDGASLREWSPPEGAYGRFAAFDATGTSMLFVGDRAGESRLIWRDALGKEHALNCGVQPLLPAFRPARDGLLHRGLTPVQAEQLVSRAGSADLALPDLQRLDAGTARALAGAQGGLRLDGLTSIDEAAALALAEWESIGEHVFLSLDGLRQPPPAVLAALARVRGRGTAYRQRRQQASHVLLGRDVFQQVDRALAAASLRHSLFVGAGRWDPADLRAAVGGRNRVLAAVAELLGVQWPMPARSPRVEQATTRQARAGIGAARFVSGGSGGIEGLDTELPGRGSIGNAGPSRPERLGGRVAHAAALTLGLDGPVGDQALHHRPQGRRASAEGGSDLLAPLTGVSPHVLQHGVGRHRAGRGSSAARREHVSLGLGSETLQAEQCAQSGTRFVERLARGLVLGGGQGLVDGPHGSERVSNGRIALDLLAFGPGLDVGNLGFQVLDELFGGASHADVLGHGV